MRFGRNRGEGEFRERFRDADDGFELPDGDGDGGPRVGGELGAVDLAADGDEVGGQLLAGFGREAGRAASVCRRRSVKCKKWSELFAEATYDLQ